MTGEAATVDAATRELLGQATMLVPTRNRQGYLRELIRQYAGTGLNLIVADTSPAPLPADALTPNVTYVHFTERRFADTLRFLVEAAPTDLVVLRAENRHITVKGVARCVAHLLAHPECSLAHGAHVWVRQKRGRIEAWPCYDADHMRGLTQARPEERLLAAFDPMVSLYYAVERRQNLRDALALAAGIENLNALEVLLTAVKAVNGVCARVPVLFCAVQERKSALKGDRGLYDGFDVVAREPRYAGQYRLLLEAVAGHLARRAGLDRERALAVTRESLERFLRRLAAGRPPETKTARLRRKAGRLVRSGLRLLGAPDMAARRRLYACLDGLEGDGRAEFAELLAIIERGYREGW